MMHDKVAWPETEGDSRAVAAVAMTEGIAPVSEVVFSDKEEFMLVLGLVDCEGTIDDEEEGVVAIVC